VLSDARRLRARKRRGYANTNSVSGGAASHRGPRNQIRARWRSISGQRPGQVDVLSAANPQCHSPEPLALGHCGAFGLDADLLRLSGNRRAALGMDGMATHAPPGAITPIAGAVG